VSEAAEPSGEPPTAWWGRECFHSVDGADGLCPAAIDVTGQGRCLTHGPYVVLQPGLWRATATLEICQDAARRRLAVQFGVEPHFSTQDLPYGIPGHHEVRVDFQLSEPGPVQIRILLRRAAFHGEVRFLGARVERLADLA
jgi:hypothetical protein